MKRRKQHLRKVSLISAQNTPARVAVCAHLPPEPENKIQNDILAMLKLRSCVRLKDFSAPVVLPKGTLVVVVTSSRKRTAGADEGLPDLLLGRTGYWGMKMIEVKKRGPKGVCGGCISVAQDIAQLAELSEIVWCVDHVRELIAEMDRSVGWIA